MEEVKDKAIRQAIASLKIDNIYLKDEFIEEYRKKVEDKKIKILWRINNDRR